MVPGDDEYGHAQAPDDAIQRLIQQGHSFLGRHGPIVEIPGDHQGFGPGVLQHGRQLVQDVGLILQEARIAEGLAQVPVGSMKEAHEDPRGA